jgi:hypothetical protein
VYLDIMLPAVCKNIHQRMSVAQERLILCHLINSYIKLRFTGPGSEKGTPMMAFLTSLTAGFIVQGVAREVCFLQVTSVDDLLFDK